MNPTVVIATHQREEITSKNIATLRMQTKVPRIVIVCSDSEEVTFYDKLGCEVVKISNRPLGLKWQAGVDYAYKTGADPLIITGSDDVLDRRFVERATLWMGRDFDFMGVKHWYVHHFSRLYYFKYTIDMPLGGGRCYSRRLLDSISGKIFDITRDRLLDDGGWAKVVNSKFRRIVFSDPLILSIKGNWPVMNDANRFFRSPNCELKGECDVSIMKRDFNYG